MAYSIAVAGKGGTGKTTLSAIILSELVRAKKGSILAVDADANSNFDEVVGAEVPKSVGSIREESLGSINKPPGGMSKEQYLKYQIQQCIYESDGFDLISMGRPEGPGCYCYANHVIRDCIDILSENYEYLVVDNEAGMEHLSRRTTINVDTLFLVSDPSLRGVKTLGRIHSLIQSLSLSVKNTYLIINRADGDLSNEVEEEIKRMGVEFLGKVNTDPNVADFDRRGVPLITLPDDSTARLTVRDFCKKIGIL